MNRARTTDAIKQVARQEVEAGRFRSQADAEARVRKAVERGDQIRSQEGGN